MKYGITLLLCCSLVSLRAQQSFRVNLLDNWNDTTLGSQVNTFSNDKQIWNDLIGWTDPNTGKEYIIMGSIDSTYFFDVSDPRNIQKCAAYDGKVRSINRDYDVYQHYVYCVSDNGDPGAFQIFDLQYLPDSVHLVLEDTTISTRTHSLCVDSASKRLYFQSGSKGAERYFLLILSLEDPENPVVVGELKDVNCNRVHEAYYRNDTAYCSCGYNGFYVYDMTRPDSIIYIGSVKPPYPYNGYNHTSWLNEDGTFLVFTDEVPIGLPIKLYSINANKKDFDYETSFNSHPGATPHNVIWLGNQLWTSAYEDGMVLWDMTNPFAPKIEAFYDTYPQNAEGSYLGLTGCWGVYPFFKSGNIAASDMRNGLFMLQYDQTLGLAEPNRQELITKLYPNPVVSELNLLVYSSGKQQAVASVYNLTGQLLIQKQIDLQEGENALKLEEVSALAGGMYMFRITSSQTINQQPFVKY
jgi:choice-of-anchor B domain-containing protein